MAGNKRKAGNGAGGNDKKVKMDIHKVGKYLPGGFPIDPKMKGVMVTCTRGREVQAGKEACDLLSEVRTISLDTTTWPLFHHLLRHVKDDTSTETQYGTTVYLLVRRKVVWIKVQ